MGLCNGRAPGRGPGASALGRTCGRGAGAAVRSLADLRAAPVGASADESGYFALSFGALPGSVLPERFELGENYPNPFDSSTIIPYQLPAPMHVRLEVFNLLGQRIATLVDGQRPAGFHTAVWDATDGWSLEVMRVPSTLDLAFFSAVREICC